MAKIATELPGQHRLARDLTGHVSLGRFISATRSPALEGAVPENLTVATRARSMVVMAGLSPDLPGRVDLIRAR